MRRPLAPVRWLIRLVTALERIGSRFAGIFGRGIDQAERQLASFVRAPARFLPSPFKMLERSGQPIVRSLDHFGVRMARGGRTVAKSTLFARVLRFFWVLNVIAWRWTTKSSQTIGRVLKVLVPPDHRAAFAPFIIPDATLPKAGLAERPEY